MTDKQINKWLRRRFSRVGWILLLYYGLMTLLTSLTAVVEMTRQGIWSFLAGDIYSSVDWDRISSNAWGYLAAMLIGFAILDAWKGRDFWKQEVLSRSSTMKISTFAFKKKIYHEKTPFNIVLRFRNLYSEHHCKLQH